ncbi:MAG: hypothetical protein KA257_10140 [Opitutaceae bacterium]|nr:hypothetical protein [Opitutaceae bacterium]
MNNKTKTMFVMQPGGFGSGGMIFSTYEFEKNSRFEDDLPPLAEISTAVAKPTQENRNWIQAAVRLPEAFRRTVWQPLSRQVQKLGSAA